MSDVSTKYSTAPSQNTSLGGLSLAENQTRFRDLNDLFRRIMADAKQESNEVRILISDATSKAADAKAAAEGAEGVIYEIQTSVAQIQSSASAASATAEQAQQAASEAVETANGIADDAANASALAQANANIISSLNDRVVNLEQAASTDATLVQTDGETIVNTSAMLKAIDVQVGEGLASARGQIGRTAVQANASLDTLVQDGWYAVGGEGISGLPEGVISGICRVSSGYASESCFQTLFVVGEQPRMFVRSTSDSGVVWTAWQEAVFAGSVGTGLTFANGILSADLSEVLPPADAEDADKALSGSGTWMDVAHPADVQAAFEAVSGLESNVDVLRTSIEAMQASMNAEPDGVTVIVEDGQYTVPNYNGATDETDGMSGLVPAAPAGSENLFLRGDGEWADPQMNTATYDGTNAGLVPPAEQTEQNLFLRGDGLWEDPTEGFNERLEVIEDLNLVQYSDRLQALETTATNDDIDDLFAEPSGEEEQEGGE